MSLAANSNLVFKYLNLPSALGGRGGVVRFMLLAHNIPFEEKLVEFADWGVEKERLTNSGENPCGSVPLIYHGNGKDKASIPLSQHISMCRYLAKVHDLSTGDDAPHEEYVQDLVSDEYQGLRNAWTDAVFGSDDDKAKYKDALPGHLTMFEALYKQFRTHDVFLGVSSKTGMPLWGDSAMFGLLRDNVRVGFMPMESLDEYPNLLAMFKAYKSIPAVSAWCDAKEKEAEA